MATIIKDSALTRAAENFVTNPIRIRAHSGDPGPDGLLNRTNGIEDINTEDFDLVETGSIANNSLVDLGILDTADAVMVTHLSIWDTNDELYVTQSLEAPILVAANSALTINSGAINFKFES